MRRELGRRRNIGGVMRLVLIKLIVGRVIVVIVLNIRHRLALLQRIYLVYMIWQVMFGSGPVQSMKNHIMAKRNLVVLMQTFLSCGAVRGTSARGGYARRTASGVRGRSVAHLAVSGSLGSCNVLFFIVFSFSPRSERRVRPTHLLFMTCGLMVRRTHPTLASPIHVPPISCSTDFIGGYSHLTLSGLAHQLKFLTPTG